MTYDDRKKKKKKGFALNDRIEDYRNDKNEMNKKIHFLVEITLCHK